MGFKLVRVDSIESCKVLLPLGSHFIGRGKFLDCHDHRVSRKHAELIVASDSILLKSLHQNPCFFKKKATKDTVILCQSETQVLSNGDQFGLIPDSYWYEVIHCLEDSPTDEEPVEKVSEDITMSEDSNTQSYDHENREDIQNVSGSIMNDFSESPSLLASNNLSPPAIAEEENDLPNIDHLEEMDVSTYLICETTEQIAVCDANDHQPSESNDVNGDSIIQPGDSTDSESTDQPVESNQAATPKRPHSEEDSPCDLKKVKTEPVTPAKDDGNAAGSSGVNAASSDQVVKNEPSSPEDVKPGPSNDQGGSSNDGNNNAAVVPPCPARQLNKPPRERCIYGANCYRKNPEHKATYSHPADADWGPGERGVCPYGASCKKRDARHWRDHTHPPAAVPPHRAGKRRRRQRSATPASDSASGSEEDASTLIVTGKRARKTIVRQGWSDSENEDPYGTDESDDWVPPNDGTTSQD